MERADHGDGRPADGPPTAADGGGTSSGLFRCPTCDRTYISRSMSSCPECDETVERVPNEAELGLVGD